MVTDHGKVNVQPEPVFAYSVSALSDCCGLGGSAGSIGLGGFTGLGGI